MGFSQIIVGISAFVTGLVPASCHHTAPPPKATPPLTAAVVSTNSALHDLGNVALTNHYERSFQLGGGKVCILYPKILDKHNEEITLTFESKLPTGQVHDMIVTQVETKTGESVDVTLGDYQLTLKPDIAEE